MYAMNEMPIYAKTKDVKLIAVLQCYIYTLSLELKFGGNSLSAPNEIAFAMCKYDNILKKFNFCYYPIWHLIISIILWRQNLNFDSPDTFLVCVSQKIHIRG